MGKEQLIDGILEHHGVLGMKWGVRKGSVSPQSTKANKKKVSQMSNDELDAYVKRLKLETAVGSSTAQSYKDAAGILTAAALATTAVVTISKNTSTIMKMIT